MTTFSEDVMLSYVIAAYGMDKEFFDNILKGLFKQTQENQSKKEELANFMTNVLQDAEILERFLDDHRWSQMLIKNNSISYEFLKNLLNTTDTSDELDKICINQALIKKILNEFILDEKTVNRFDDILKDSDLLCRASHLKNSQSLLFDYIDLRSTHYRAYYGPGEDDYDYEKISLEKVDQELLKLNETNKSLYRFDLNSDQKLELIEILKNSESAQNTLKQIVDNHLEDQYDCETLKELLTKDNNKNLKTKFNF